VSDATQPRDRARVVGVYRFWRDFGFVLGALAAGLGADAVGSGPTIAAVAVLTGASGIAVAATRWRRQTIDERLRKVQAKIRRLEPQQALAAARTVAMQIDLPAQDEPARTDVIP